jgi:hypothetical protein
MAKLIMSRWLQVCDRRDPSSVAASNSWNRVVSNRQRPVASLSCDSPGAHFRRQVDIAHPHPSSVASDMLPLSITSRRSDG